MSLWLALAAVTFGAAVVFAVGLRLGILLGRRLDRLLEARAARAAGQPAVTQNGKEAE
jgi:HAMP domain-containing protein